MIQTISINYEDIKSINQAERQKANLENRGFSLLDTLPNGFNKFNLIYEGVF